MEDKTETTKTIRGVLVRFWFWDAAEAEEAGYGADCGGGPGWFWAEDDCDANGPYATREEAIAEAEEFAADWSDDE